MGWTGHAGADRSSDDRPAVHDHRRDFLVVPGHRQPAAPADGSALACTREYIAAFRHIVAEAADGAADVVLARYTAVHKTPAST